MKIGILSDTHGNLDLALVAAQEFISRGIEGVLHCGDIGSPDVLTGMAALFQPLDIPLYAVIGNRDEEVDWDFFPAGPPIHMLERVAKLTLAGKQITLSHGDVPHFYETEEADDRNDYIIFGHSHVREDRFVNQIHMINPGTAGCGDDPTCVFLDLATDQVDIIHLSRSNYL